MPFRFEPIVDLRSGASLGHELLAGRTHCAERTDWEWAAWYALLPEIVNTQAPQGGQIFVNASGGQLAESAIVDALCAIHDRHRVVIEWTEHVAPGVSTRLVVDAAVEMLSVLRKLGFRVAIDDVGSGLDGILRVIETSPEFVKLDMKLLHYARDNKRATDLLRDLRVLFQNLGACVIAEGIETAFDLALVKQSGIVLGQGWFFLPDAKSNRLGVRPASFSSLALPCASRPHAVPEVF